jgi:hypothetical protein
MTFLSRVGAKLSPPVVAALVVSTGMCAASLLVWQTSKAAFNSSTSNAANSWTAGTVALSDDDSSAAMFSATGLVPGSTATKCISVTYGGDVTSSVKLYGASPTTTNALSSWLDMTIEIGAGGSFGSCTAFTPASTIFTGTLNTFGATKTAFGSGLGTWAPTASGQTKEYRFTWTLNSAAPNSVMGGTAGISFVWESQA